MDELAMACGIGFILGVVLFLILALTGYIDKWSNNIDKWLSSKSANK